MNPQQTNKAQTGEITTCDVAILFCDLRGIANFWQSASAVEVILFINSYFADISKIIDAHQGVINQFFDDTVLAIFGLETGCQPVAQAIKAALAIIAHSAALDKTNAVPSAVSIGIDFSSVQVGTLLDTNAASYQYLIMGDSAENAKSLQALSCTLGKQIILSQEAYKRLPEAIRQHFINLGEHKLTAGTEPTIIYGNEKTAPEPSLAA
ncbi:MAG: adenylate/guanylate cyclase domain-containing protein [Methylovulum sp.]|nr:adenylate/guanylate cyclase domain-containing protein [Methylovulum sp.]